MRGLVASNSLQASALRPSTAFLRVGSGPLFAFSHHRHSFNTVKSGLEDTFVLRSLDLVPAF
jgi:hypothetical protein